MNNTWHQYEDKTEQSIEAAFGAKMRFLLLSSLTCQLGEYFGTPHNDARYGVDFKYSQHNIDGRSWHGLVQVTAGAPCLALPFIRVWLVRSWHGLAPYYQ